MEDKIVIKGVKSREGRVPAGWRTVQQFGVERIEEAVLLQIDR